MKSITYCFLLIFILLPSLSVAQTITLDDFLKLVRENHPFFKKEALSSDIERQEQKGFLGDEDWIVRTKTFYAHEESARTGSLTPNEIDFAGIDAALERKYWKTGGQLSFGYDYARSDQKANDFVIPGFATIPGESGVFHENSLIASYSHPLLNNRGGVLSRLGYELQGFDVKATDVNIIENQEAFLLELGDSFIDWVLLTEQRRIFYKRLALAEEELERTSRKRNQNLVDEVDVLRARDSALNVEQNVLGIESRWKARQTELATIAQINNHSDFNPEYDIYALAELPSVESALAKLKQDSRMLSVLRIRLEQLDHEKMGFIEQGKPSLSFDVSGGLKSGDTKFRNSSDYDTPQYSAALIFSYPLGNRTSKADIHKTKLEKERTEENMKNIELELESRLRNLMTQLTELQKVLTLNRKQIVVAKDKTKAELHRYNQGRIELTFVIQSRDNEQNIQLIHAQNGAIYHKLLLRYYEVIDGLIKSSM